MKHRPFSELTKHWPPERTAKIEARVDTALAELDRPLNALGRRCAGRPPGAVLTS